MILSFKDFILEDEYQKLDIPKDIIDQKRMGRKKLVGFAHPTNGKIIYLEDKNLLIDDNKIIGFKKAGNLSNKHKDLLLKHDNTYLQKKAEISRNSDIAKQQRERSKIEREKKELEIKREQEYLKSKEYQDKLQKELDKQEERKKQYIAERKKLYKELNVPDNIHILYSPLKIVSEYGNNVKVINPLYYIALDKMSSKDAKEYKFLELDKNKCFIHNDYVQGVTIDLAYKLHRGIV